MTKEEILFPLHQHCPEEIERVYSHENAVQAMDTYGRQEAIAFNNWVRNNTVADGAPKLLHTTGRKTTEELYDLYQEQKQKR